MVRYHANCRHYERNSAVCNKCFSMPAEPDGTHKAMWEPRRPLDKGNVKYAVKPSGGVRRKASPRLSPNGRPADGSVSRCPPSGGHRLTAPARHRASKGNKK
jgi:hypothetical protein